MIKSTGGRQFLCIVEALQYHLHNSQRKQAVSDNASPSHWGDVTGQLKVFIDRCTLYCNTNPARLPISSSAKGVAVAVRAGTHKEENMNLVHTIEHFLGHLDIPLISSFTVEGIDSESDLLQRPQVLADAYAFGENLCRLLD